MIYIILAKVNGTQDCLYIVKADSIQQACVMIHEEKQLCHYVTIPHDALTSLHFYDNVVIRKLL